MSKKIEEVDWFKILNKPLFNFDDLIEVDRIRYLKLDNCHIGQRKLFLNEVYFYKKYNPKLVIYSGSASGEHTDLILKMFPNLKLIMIDPNYHMFKSKFKYIYKNNNIIDNEHKKIIKSRKKNIFKVEFYNGETYNVLDNESHGSIDDLDYKNLSRVSVIQDYMSEELAVSLSKKLKNYCYLSDIRTTLCEDLVSDLDILYNSALQAIVLNILKPNYSMLKFVIPTFINRKKACMEDIPDFIIKILDRSKDFGFKFLEDYKEKKFRYYDGEIYLQSWAPHKSEETRLILEKTLFIKEYDILSYHRKMNYYNIFRGVGYINHKEIVGYDHSNDSSLELYILQDFHITKKVIDKFIKDTTLCNKITKPSTSFTYTYEEDYKEITKTIKK